MKPRIEVIEEKTLIGMSLPMSVADNQTFKLFSTFMPRRKEIRNAVNADIFDLRVYPADYFQAFDPTKVFTKWALSEVSQNEEVPSQMEKFKLPGGKYAVFTHKGPSADMGIFQYIFTQWLPKSGYSLDSRPHFEILGEKYSRQDPNSEEEIWIPVV
ncbi:MAG: GyrI-like domain-containing protein [Flavobacteriaceae bacterium]